MEESKNLAGGIVSTALKVITNPWGFYREMPKTGGYQGPIIFLIVMILIAAIINTIGAISHIGVSPMGAGMGAASALTGIIIAPVIGLIVSFVIAGILFVIWKLMGSPESFETAYRCAAYNSGIIPITSIIGFIPYIGSIVSIVWGFYLLIIASIEVHKIKSSLAWTVWGIIAALFIILSLSAQYAARKFAGELNMQPGGQMTEEQQKQMEESMKKMQEEMTKQTPQKQGTE